MDFIANFSVADLIFSLYAQQPVDIAENFTSFQTNETRTDFSVYMSWTDQFPEMLGEPVFQGSTLDVYSHNGRFIHCYHNLNNSDCVHSISHYDPESKVASVRYKAEKMDPTRESRNWLAHSGFEEMLLSRDRMIVHASLIDTKFGGILFCGPSGVGKSTQARLWENHEGCSLINGDRPIVGKKQNGWFAYGAPYAGSSLCYVNRCLPIRAIVMLAQGKKCNVRRFRVSEAFRRLYAETVINSWDAQFVSKACDLMSELVSDVPVYHFTCTADQNAVASLKAVLERDDV